MMKKVLLIETTLVFIDRDDTGKCIYRSIFFNRFNVKE